MYSSYFLPILKQHLRMCSFLKGLPFEYDDETGLVVKTRCHGTIIIFKLQCLLSVLYCSAMFLNLVIGPSTLIEKLKGVIFFLMYFNTTIARWNYSLDPTPIQVINSFLKYEATTLRGAQRSMPPSRSALAMTLYMRIVEISIIFIPGMLILILSYQPCLPPFILSMSRSCESTYFTPWTCCHRVRKLMIVGVHLFETWMGLHIIVSGYTWLGFALFAGITCIVHYFRILERYVIYIRFLFYVLNERVHSADLNLFEITGTTGHA
ncbi:hypothetical protein Fcan01_00957 [Folsomia candida]|uniref:Uncharacterized protein n=1 Tax=Folsomia candida TaxID=158441 RepID=A0A226EYR8_FOLCA|nr:hypothetical protein Fcan01_00957 [Folsomia candida]